PGCVGDNLTGPQGVPARWVQATPNHSIGVRLAVVLVVGADVPGQAGPLPLLVVRLDCRCLDEFASRFLDRVRDVGVQLRSALGAEARPGVVLAPTVW